MIWYLLATCAVFGLSFWAYLNEPRRYADLMGVSVMLTLSFVICNLIVTLYGLPEALLSFPILDLTFSVMISACSGAIRLAIARASVQLGQTMSRP